MAPSAKGSHGVHRLRVLGLWFGGFLAGAYAWQLASAIGTGASLVLPTLGLVTGIAITAFLGTVLWRRHHPHE